MDIDAELRVIAGRLGNGGRERTTPRRLVQLFGAERRGAIIVEQIRSRLARHHLKTEPDFNEVGADDEVAFVFNHDTPLHVAKLTEADERLTKGEPPLEVDVRTLMSWFGAERRGNQVVERIRAALDGLELQTEPDFQSTHVDSSVKLTRPSAKATEPEDAAPHASVPGVEKKTHYATTFRVGTLAEANRAHLVSVPPKSSLAEAVTAMLTHGVSHLPVLQGERSLRGVVRWKDIAKRLVLAGGTVQDPVETVMRPAVEVRMTDPFLGTIPHILQHGCVFVRDDQNRVTGVVTKKDLGRRLEERAHPFVLLEEIEKSLRALIERADFTPEELKRDGLDPSQTREIRSVSDLTLGETIRLLQKDDAWNRVGINLAKTTFLTRLDDVRKIRNNIMHFDPESPTPSDKRTLLVVCQLFYELRELNGAP